MQSKFEIVAIAGFCFCPVAFDFYLQLVKRAAEAKT